MRARLIVNPKSGADRAVTLLPRINETLRSFVSDLDITVTTCAEDAERAAARALADGCDALYVAGGDGTLNAAVRGLITPGGSACAMPIGIIPFGTGNDFARALGMGEDAETALDALLARRVVDVDIGTLNDRPFVNTSAGGFVAHVSEAVTEGLKDVTGKLAYLIGGARALFSSAPFSGRIVVPPGADATAAAWPGAIDIEMFAVCNARFIGGGYPIAPSARVDDGLLDVLVVPQMSVLEFVGVLQGIAAGEPASGQVLSFRASAFDLEFSRAVRVNTDGEVLEAKRASYRIRPRAARFFCGASPYVV